MAGWFLTTNLAADPELRTSLLSDLGEDQEGRVLALLARAADDYRRPENCSNC